MTALFAIITFFFIFVVAYLAVATVLAVVTWWLKGRAAARDADARIQEIERKMDRVKEKAFVIALVLTFFVVTPFVVILLFVRP
jgi:predicted MFS family arabinose efflux permease